MREIARGRGFFFRMLLRERSDVMDCKGIFESGRGGREGETQRPVRVRLQVATVSREGKMVHSWIYVVRTK